ncbi:MAG TPA: MraY family glycosyltransferase [bacterium]|nr:MraY family glycosyltransferase [bacterium]HOL48111.1 MraY family glycosyltransferase [bacterium]HPQ18104.1 MraY family glycosyltransferase [bacterium]
MLNKIDFLVLIFSFFISLIVIRVIIYIAKKINFLDKPDNELKKHKKPIPYAGGTGIFIVFTILIIYFFFTKNLPINKLFIFLIFSFFIHILGLIDDLKRLKPYTKLFFQIIISVFLIISSFQINIKIIKDFFPFLNYIFSIVWFLAIINAFNLIDILDGLCAGISILSILTFIFIAFITKNEFVFFIGISLLIPLCGFYFFNYPPAKIFLGDAGSMFIGFIFSIISVDLSYTNINKLGLIIPFVILGLPIYDLILVSLFRILKGKSPLIGSHDHFALRLLSLNFSVKRVLFTFYLLNIFFSLNSFFILKLSYKYALLALVNIFIIIFIIGLIIHKVDFDK